MTGFERVHSGVTTRVQDLTPGAIDELKSGGPLMTVTKIKRDGSLRCIWHDIDDVLQEHDFPAAMLNLVQIVQAGRKT